MLAARDCHGRSGTPAAFLLLIATLSATPALAQVGASLGIQPGARQNGLGAAGVALFGDPSDALWWNPAALGFADRTSVQFTYAELLPGLADIPYYHVAAAAPLGTFGGFGTSFTHARDDDFFLPFNESSPSIAIGVPVHRLISIGANLKWVSLDYGYSGETFSTDVGALLRVDRQPWKLGFGVVYQNLGGRVDFPFEDDSFHLPRNWKLGASAAVPLNLTEKLRVGAVAVVDYNQSDVESEFHVWNTGVEGHLTYDDVLRLAARGGYYYDRLGEIEDVTYGIGVRAWVAAIDAAWYPQARNADLDRVLKITAGIHVDLSSGRPRWRMD